MNPSVLVLGAGSIGSRHARNLVAAGADVSVADPEPARAGAVTGATPVAYDLGAMADHDGVVIASPTSEHAAQARAAVSAGVQALVEKPLARTTAEANGIATAGDRLMVGYNLRFHAPVRRMMRLVHGGRIGRITAARLWFGSYLPDWRPGTDFRASYSARADLGGGILLDAIHELDLAVWLLGPRFEVMAARMEQLGDLGIDVEDTVKALLRHESGALVELSLDYLSRRYRRGIEVIGTDGTIRLDWAREVIEVEDGEDLHTELATAPIDRSYREEAGCFLQWLSGEARPPVDATTGLDSLRLADQIREAAGR